MDLSEDLIHLIRKAVSQQWDISYLLEKTTQLYDKSYAAEQRVRTERTDRAMRWILNNEPGNCSVTKYRTKFVKYCRVRLTDRDFNQVMIRLGYVHKRFKYGIRWCKDIEESESDDSDSSDEDSEPDEDLDHDLVEPKKYVFVVSVPAYTETVIRIDSGDEKTIDTYDPQAKVHAKVHVEDTKGCVSALIKKFGKKFVVVDDNDTFSGDLGDMMILFNKIVAGFQ